MGDVREVTMSDFDRLGIALQIEPHLRVRTITPDDDDYTGDGTKDQHVIDGIAEAAEEIDEVIAKKHELALRLLESAQRHLDVIPRERDSRLVAPGRPAAQLNIAQGAVEAAIALLREGKVPARMMEGVG
jgi:hypothetical protein